MLSNSLRPSSTALTIEAKLSSVKTISAASFATSLPFFPMAMPTSARFKAGESLTPSPVITQKACRRCIASTIRTLVVGLHRAMTRGNCSMESISSSVIRSKLSAAMTNRLALMFEIILSRIPTSDAMAVAVRIWSPVSMCTVMPAI